jgi:hypothetical protein
MVTLRGRAGTLADDGSGALAYSGAPADEEWVEISSAGGATTALAVEISDTIGCVSAAPSETKAGLTRNFKAKSPNATRSEARISIRKLGLAIRFKIKPRQREDALAQQFDPL